MKKYNIVAICNPYNAKSHYYGQKVLKYDGATPVKWLIEEDLTLEKAMDILDIYTSFFNDNYLWIDNDDVEEWKSIDVDTSWYKGEGLYLNCMLVYKHGDMYLEQDVMTYAIEEVE